MDALLQVSTILIGCEFLNSHVVVLTMAWQTAKANVFLEYVPIHVR